MFDVAVLGGGPAGCAAAISLRRLCPSLKIALLESTNYQQWRIGETLSPLGQELLRGLGCWEQFLQEQFLESFGTCAAWGGDHLQENEFLFSPRGNGWHLERTRFDAMLCRAAQHAGVDVFKETRFVDAEGVDNGDGWRLTVRHNHEMAHLDARFVVDATGRSAAFATRQGAKRQVEDRLIGVVAMFSNLEGRLIDRRTLVEAQPDGWWYSALLPDGRAVVAWMSDADLVRSRQLHRREGWLEHLSRSRFTRNRLCNGTMDASLHLWAAQSQRLNHFCGNHWVATGDAAGTFDPLSSAGILKALRWGKIASFAAADHFAQRSFSQRYDSLLHREYESYLHTRQRFYRMERRWPEAAFWTRRS